MNRQEQPGKSADPDPIPYTGPRVLENRVNKPGIGGLGEPDYQAESLRIKSFCPEVIETVDQYRHYLETQLFPAADAHEDITRIIDRAIIKRDLFLPSEGLRYGVRTEAVVHLGGRWEGYDWAMNGASKPGRELSNQTKADLLMLASEAKAMTYTPPQELPPGFTMEKLVSEKISGQDLQDLAEIFRLAFTNYISPLTTPFQVHAWLNSGNIYPVGIRNADGKLVVVANGDIAKMSFGRNREFRFFEIGDSAGHPDYRQHGLNRRIKHFLLSEAAKMGFDSIHTETRAAWISPNIGNAKNGMSYSGTLWLNCQIGGPEDVHESQDPLLVENSRRMGSLNIWAMTPLNPLWEQYEEYSEPNMVL